MNISDSDEEEEEMIFLVFPAQYLLFKKTKIPMNTSILMGPKYIQELLDGHPTRCYDVLRVLNFKMLRSVKCNGRCVRWYQGPGLWCFRRCGKPWAFSVLSLKTLLFVVEEGGGEAGVQLPACKLFLPLLLLHIDDVHVICCCCHSDALPIMLCK